MSKPPATAGVLLANVESRANLFFTEKARCYAMAKTFYFAVDKLGDGPFESAQDDACEWECCGMINYGRQDFINAYPEF